jgi:cytochrome c oxidase subunit II
VRPPTRARGIRRLAPAVAGAVTLAACELPSFGAPDPKSEQGEDVYRLWQGFFVASIFVALLVWGLIGYSLIRYRRRNDDLPDQRPYIIPLEIFYTATPIVVVAVLFGFSWITADAVTEVTDDPDVRVDVVGFQWGWQFAYPDEGFTVLGVSDQPPEMVLPVGRTAQLDLRATDVNHSFWVPDFLSKRDLIPGVDNDIDVTPTEPGEYIGRCAEFCGLDHWAMYFNVRVVEPDEYDDWLAEQKAVAESGGSETVEPILPDTGVEDDIQPEGVERPEEDDA